MIVRPAVDKSCKKAKNFIVVNANSKKADKAFANRAHRRAFKHIIADIQCERTEWDEAIFDLPGLTSWDIF